MITAKMMGEVDEYDGDPCEGKPSSPSLLTQQIKGIHHSEYGTDLGFTNTLLDIAAISNGTKQSSEC
jgi:hypothetical protein